MVVAILSHERAARALSSTYKDTLNQFLPQKLPVVSVNGHGQKFKRAGDPCLVRHGPSIVDTAAHPCFLVVILFDVDMFQISCHISKICPTFSILVMPCYVLKLVSTYDV